MTTVPAGPSALAASLVACLAGAAVGVVSPRLARIALAGGRPADGLDARPLDPLSGLGRSAAVVAALLTALLAVAMVGSTPPDRLRPALLLLAAGPVLVLADLAAHRLPDRATAPAAVAAAGLALVTGGGALLLQAAWCGAGALTLLAFLRVATGGGLGAGDVKLGGVLGLVLGQLGVAAAGLGLAAGTMIGGVAATVLLLAGGARASSAVPFGPWLLAGALLVAAGPATLSGAHG